MEDTRGVKDNNLEQVEGIYLRFGTRSGETWYPAYQNNKS